MLFNDIWTHIFCIIHVMPFSIDLKEAEKPEADRTIAGLVSRQGSTKQSKVEHPMSDNAFFAKSEQNGVNV